MKKIPTKKNITKTKELVLLESALTKLERRYYYDSQDPILTNSRDRN